jgi:hypothetical protein
MGASMDMAIKHRKNRTRKTLLLVLLAAAMNSRAADKAPPPAQPASTYPDADTHATEHVSIAAEPFDLDKAAFFHVNYPAYGIMPVRMIITNDGDKPISLSQARIDFIDQAGDKIPAAQFADIQRIINIPPNKAEQVPLGPIKIGGKGKNKNKQIKEDLDEYGFSSIAIEPHTTHDGFFFYDVSELEHPLVGAKLEVREVQDAKGDELFAFEIPFYKLGGRY